MRFTLFALLGLSLFACRDGGNGDDDDTPNPDAPPGGDFVTIQQIQDDAMAVGTAVKLQNVVVSGIDAFGARTGDMWVQDPAGGPFSGIKVFGAPLDVVAGLQVGDVVTITNAEKDEFALMTDMSGLKVTEIKGAAGGALSIQKTGTMTLTPTVVDALAIDMLPTFDERAAEWEKWEGVLITATKVRQVGALTTFGAAEDQKLFKATGGIEVQSLLTDLGPAVAGTCYQGITGIGDYFFSYKLLPRAADELVAGGTDCATLSSATVTDIQMGTVTGAVQLNNVFITAIDDIPSSRGIWVADALAGAAHNGVLVFLGNTTLDPQLAIGATVNVLGTVSEFDVGGMTGDKLTELVQANVTFVAAPGAAPTPNTQQTVATLSDIGANGEPWEGVLVQVANVKVTNVNAGQGKVELTDNNGGKIIMDNDAFDFPAQTANTCYGTLTGVMSVQLTDDIRTINPRSAADLVVGNGCN